ncbi:Mitochondrial L-2-hydroxyglutarate dehydrogenase [Fasciola hepatica]|uniref:L-2-hydroxyglutarate dehydrogenase, mitochondrial n=1 Tax=Fasciola hepatica TaxID=6192 RepID=A0A4E0R820_FASHE|nr:Mitochondrial L-2-hydroxyglutarate dehydrogenase [Fasciola hepatica]
MPNLPLLSRFVFSSQSTSLRNLSNLFHSPSKYDFTIVGGGIVGLATARELQLRYPKSKFVLLEKEKNLSIHQSKNNSGVIHSGIYYAPGSLKAKLCVEGMRRSYEYLERKNLPYKKCGKLIVATNDLDVTRLDALFERGTQNKVPGLEILTPDGIRQVESRCVGVKAIYSPETGIVDWRTVALSFAEDFKKHGGTIFTGFQVDKIGESAEDSNYPVAVHARVVSNSTTPNSVQTKHLITCAGLQSDRVAKMTGCSSDPKIVPFRGDYLRLKDDRSDMVKTNIYPVPDPRFPFLGVHFTPRIDGTVWLGPNAILSLDREGYGLFDFRTRDALDSLFYPGFLKLAVKYTRFGLNEMISNLILSRQVKQLQRYVPSLRREDVIRGPSGIRAQALNRAGQLVDDFVIDVKSQGIGKHVMHVRNAPSPAATSSMAIARYIADEARSHFGLSEPSKRNYS